MTQLAPSGPATLRPAMPAVRLSDALSDRRNSLNFLRFVFASLVIFSHSFALSAGSEPSFPIGSWGGVGVTGFFLLSGYLIARSWIKSPSLGGFAWRRALRILPGLWVCLVVTAMVIGPIDVLVEGGSLSTYFSAVHGGPWTYVASNLTTVVHQGSIHGILAGVPFANTENGSLWTLAWEVLCYGGVAIAGLLGVLRRHRALVALVALLWLANLLGTVHPSWLLAGSSPYRPAAGIHLVLAFGVGMLAAVFADRIPVTSGVAAAAAGVMVASLFLNGTAGAVLGMLTIPATCYVYLWLGARLPLAWFGARHDVSYGLYIYAFPVQQALADAGLAHHGVVGYLTVSFVVTLGLAWLSWQLVESRALALKSWRPRSVRVPLPRAATP